MSTYTRMYHFKCVGDAAPVNDKRLLVEKIVHNFSYMRYLTISASSVSVCKT